MSDVVMLFGDFDADGHQNPPDVFVEAGDLSLDDGVQSSILMSILTDRRVDGERGWWGDGVDGDNFGSRLWTLDGRATVENARLAKDYIKEALQWMLDDGSVESFEIVTEIDCNRLKWQVTACIGADTTRVAGNA